MSEGPGQRPGPSSSSWCSGYDVGLDARTLEWFLDFTERTWGTDGPLVPIFGPVVGNDVDFRVRMARMNRLVLTAREAVATQRAINDFDVRDLLDSVRCPCLVVHLTDSIIGAAPARWLADHVPNGSYVELSGAFIPVAQEARDLAISLGGFLCAR